MRRIIYKFDLEASLSKKGLAEVCEIHSWLEDAIRDWQVVERNTKSGSLHHAYKLMFMKLAKKYADHNPKYGRRTIEGRYPTRVKIPLSTSSKPPIPAAIEEYLAKKGVTITDYTAGKGTLTKEVRRRDGSSSSMKELDVRIGSVLNDNPALKKIFDNDPNRAASRAMSPEVADRFVLVCRHPRDIIGISSGKEWSADSCLEAIDGDKNKVLDAMIEHGAIAVFLFESRQGRPAKAVARNLIYPAYRISPDTPDVISVSNPNEYVNHISGKAGAARYRYIRKLGLQISDADIVNALNVKHPIYLTNSRQNAASLQANEVFLYLSQKAYGFKNIRFPSDFRKVAFKLLQFFFNKEYADDGLYLRSPHFYYDVREYTEGAIDKYDVIKSLRGSGHQTRGVSSLFKVKDGEFVDTYRPKIVTNGLNTIIQPNDVSEVNRNSTRVDQAMAKLKATFFLENGELNDKSAIVAGQKTDDVFKSDNSRDLIINVKDDVYESFSQDIVKHILVTDASLLGDASLNKTAARSRAGDSYSKIVNRDSLDVLAKEEDKKAFVVDIPDENLVFLRPMTPQVVDLITGMDGNIYKPSAIIKTVASVLDTCDQPTLDKILKSNREIMPALAFYATHIFYTGDIHMEGVNDSISKNGITKKLISAPSVLNVKLELEKLAVTFNSLFEVVDNYDYRLDSKEKKEEHLKNAKELWPVAESLTDKPPKLLLANINNLGGDPFISSYAILSALMYLEGVIYLATNLIEGFDRYSPDERANMPEVLVTIDSGGNKLATSLVDMVEGLVANPKVTEIISEAINTPDLKRVGGLANILNRIFNNILEDATDERLSPLKEAIARQLKIAADRYEHAAKTNSFIRIDDTEALTARAIRRFSINLSSLSSLTEDEDDE